MTFFPVLPRILGPLFPSARSFGMVKFATGLDENREWILDVDFPIFAQASRCFTVSIDESRLDPGSSIPLFVTPRNRPPISRPSFTEDLLEATIT